MLALAQGLGALDFACLLFVDRGYVHRRTTTPRLPEMVAAPPGEEHWHGATEGNFMCHYALLEGTADGDGTSWLEPVTDPQYRQAQNA